jgi:hypothetical protein
MKLRFTIRDLFWLTLVAALAVAGWIQSRKIASLENDLFLSEHRIRTTDITIESLTVPNNFSLIAPPEAPNK